MKDSLYIKSQLDATLSTKMEQTDELKKAYEAKANILNWLYNAGNCRTEEEINTRLQTCEERLTALNFMGDMDPTLKKSINMEINTLKDVLI